MEGAKLMEGAVEGEELTEGIADGIVEGKELVEGTIVGANEGQMESPIASMMTAQFLGQISRSMGSTTASQAVEQMAGTGCMDEGIEDGNRDSSMDRPVLSGSDEGIEDGNRDGSMDGLLLSDFGALVDFGVFVSGAKRRVVLCFPIGL